MDHGNRITIYQRGNSRLLDKAFKIKPIKEGDKTLI